jgi:allantoinase
MNIPTKVITNIFINSDGNKLYPATIYFSDKIEKIEKLSGTEYDWSEIKNKTAKEEIIKKIPVPSFPNNIKVIDGKFNLLMPGAIDPHVHFDTPGFEFRDDFEHGTTAAAYGGVTTIIDMPCTSLPPVTNKKNFEYKLKAIENRSLTDFALWGGVRGNDFCKTIPVEEQIKELNELGVAGYKVYVISGMDTFTDLTYERITEAAKAIAITNKPMAVHAEDKKIVLQTKQKFISNNQNEWQHYCKARSEKAEAVAIGNVIAATGNVDVKIHIVHLSSQLGLEKIKEARSKGIKITTETCPHYLYFTQKDFENEKIRNYLKTAPPVKLEKDKSALWKGIKDGSIHFVTTDHAGTVPDKEKVSENFWKVYGGIPGVEYRVPFLFSEGFIKGNLTLSKTIELLSTNAAEYFKLKGKGKIEKYYDADFALINLWESKTVKANEMHSKGKYTPFDSVVFNATVEQTYLRGKIIMNNYGEAEEKIGYGKFVKI